MNSTGSALLYSTYIGGSDNDYGYGIAVDGSSSAYVAGTTHSTDYPTTFGAFQENGWGHDCFVTELNASVSGLVYSTYVGGNSGDLCYDITVDESGQAYKTGETVSSNYPVTTFAYQATNDGAGSDLFVTKLSADGSTLLYSTLIGGGFHDWGNGIAVDGSGHAYVTGETWSSDYDVTPGAFQTTSTGYIHGFVTKLNSTGSALVYSTYIVGNVTDGGYDITVDDSGRAFVTGYTGGGPPITPGAIQPDFSGGWDTFLITLNVDGSALLYSTYIGGMLSDEGRGVFLDESEKVYVTGFTSGIPVTQGAFQTTQEGGFDVFVTKVCPTGISLTSAPGTDNQTACFGAPITPITYSTLGITTWTVINLPTGVTHSFDGSTLTISGTSNIYMLGHLIIH